MTIEELNRIKAKKERGEKLLPEEWCEGFSVVDGKLTDENIHGSGTEWTEDDEFVFGKYRNK